MTLGRILPWIAALALAVLGWYAMIPVWAGGLCMAALGADFQPALWFATARVALVLGGVVFILRVVVAFTGTSRFEPLLRKGLILGLGLYLTAFVLLLAMGGQPLRAWFLVAQWEWGNPLCLGTLGFAVCLLTLLIGLHRGIIEYAVALSGLGAFILLTMQLSPGLPVVNGRLVIPNPQDWLVLAFALACGAYASWLRVRGHSEGSGVAAD